MEGVVLVLTVITVLVVASFYLLIYRERGRQRASVGPLIVIRFLLLLVLLMSTIYYVYLVTFKGMLVDA